MKYEPLHTLQKQANNRSPKPHKRLMASLAAIELRQRVKAMVGSERRGFLRGRLW